MKSKIVLSLVILLNVSVVFAQSGKALTGGFESRHLNQTANYSIYLPPGYEESAMEYPVLYLLHGGGDNYKDWLLKGQAATIADRTINSGEAPAMIIVMPDGIKNWYCNDYKNEFRYEDFFYEELIPHIEANYRARTEKAYRAISGLSMGGFGSLLYALKHPDMFTACYGMSVGLFSEARLLSGNTRTAPGQGWYGEAYFGPKTADGKLPEHWYKNDVFTLIRNMPEAQKRQVHFAIEVGDDELNRDQAESFLLMKDHNIPVEVRIVDGGHNWILWRKCLPNAMKFVGEAFLQERTLWGR